jgi:phosphoribosylformylglycinamidine synthase
MPNRETVIPKRAERVPVLGLSDAQLVQLSTDRLLSLSLDEMRAVQKYFSEADRDPLDCELETIAQTWSEHCKHKTFKGIIDFTDREKDSVQHHTFDDLLKETVVKATKDIDHPDCLSVFKDNAGVIAFDKKWALAFKVETHNHPSALEPYGGAGTGLGGVIRDILGVGLGAKPILNTDVFCVGEFGMPSAKDDGMLPPERILPRVIAGVRDYGNRMGIPTANGAVLFNKGYYANPLVFCGTVGLIPRDKIEKKVSPGELIVATGGRTGRDGIHGATFSSLALEKDISASVVQIGNAIVEKKAAEALLRARDKNLFTAVTDCGAGGFSSAIGELASECGARVHLEKAPLKYAGLQPWEIWLSESQERMVFSVPKDKIAEFQKICETEDVECCVLGEFTDDLRLRVMYEGETVCDLDVTFLHDGIPRVRKKAVWTGTKPEHQSAESEVSIKNNDFNGVVKKLMSHPNIASKKWVVRQYDHEVQGGSIVKPFVGAEHDGPSDAAVYRPLLDSWKGYAVSNGLNPLFGEIDSYWMAANAIDEALRNFAAVGGDVEHAAILDNFCWGNIHDPEIMGELVRCSQGCHDFAKVFGVPFISGKDSLNNTWRQDDGKVLSIPGTLLISAIGLVHDVRRSVTMDLKKPGDRLLLLGETRNELGGSHFNVVTGSKGGLVPRVDGVRSRRMMLALRDAIGKGLVRACHDLSEGGLAVALAEMSLAGNLGARVQLSGAELSDAAALFSESASRWVLEVEPGKLAQVRRLFKDMPLAEIGSVDRRPQLSVRGKKEIVRIGVPELRKLWHAFSEAQ